MNLYRNINRDDLPTLDHLDMEMFEADKRRYRNFVPAPGSWAASIPSDPFMVDGVDTVAPF